MLVVFIESTGFGWFFGGWFSGGLFCEWVSGSTAFRMFFSICVRVSFLVFSRFLPVWIFT
jgi:hypothetical protein